MARVNQVTLSLSAEQDEELRALSKKTMVSISRHMRNALDQYLEKYSKQKKENM